MKRFYFVALSLALLLLSACSVVSPSPSSEPIASPPEPGTSEGSAPPSSVEPSVEPSPEESPEPLVPSEESTPTYPLYLPMPYYRTFFDEPEGGNIDAFLHNTAVNYYSSSLDALQGDLLIPSLRLLDEWDAGGGSTYYLCFMAEYDYYCLGEKMTGNAMEQYPWEDSGGGGSLIRFKVTPDDINAVENYWGFLAVEIMEEPEHGDGYPFAVKYMCGDRPISELLLSDELTKPEIPYIRDILPSEYAHNTDALLRKYFEYYFPEYADYTPAPSIPPPDSKPSSAHNPNISQK